MTTQRVYWREIMRDVYICVGLFREVEKRHLTVEQNQAMKKRFGINRLEKYVKSSNLEVKSVE